MTIPTSLSSKSLIIEEQMLGSRLLLSDRNATLRRLDFPSSRWAQVSSWR